MHCDLIIIGAGPAGYRAADYAARNGLKVTIFEAGHVGGTCLNVGCIPTKCYVHSATFQEARERVAQVVPQLRAGVEQLLSHPNITLVRQHASFVPPSSLLPPRESSHTVVAGGVEYSAPHILVATGSETKWLNIPGDRSRVVDSTGLLAVDTLPRRLAIIGAGVIGMEFASVFNRFGSEVTVIEYLKECLPALDSDIAKRLRKLMEKRGVEFRMKTAVSNLDDIDADLILMATGRKPRTEGLNLEAAGPDVQLVGDVNGRQLLAHAAEMQAIHAVNQILGRPDDIRLDIMPAAIFTDPEAACVGPSEDQLKAQGIDYVCRKSFWRANGKAMAMGQTEGMLKLFASPADGRILGCHAYGAHAADIIQEVSSLMCRDTTIAQLASMVHIHPTLSEILLAAAEQFQT